MDKFYWTTAVIFLGRDLNKALIRYLEDLFVQIARESKRYKVLTKNTYGKTVVKKSQTAATLRKKHLASNKVKDFVTTEDILFSRSSAAADFVTGYSVSGPATWKNSAGVTLKELETKATK